MEEHFNFHNIGSVVTILYEKGLCLLLLPACPSLQTLQRLHVRQRFQQLEARLR